MKKLTIKTVFFFIVILLSSVHLPAQSNDKTSARIDLQYFNLAVNNRQIRVKVTTKINRRHTPVPGAQLKIFLNQISDDTQLGSITTNSKGLNNFILPPEYYRTLDTISEVTFICSLTDHPKLKDKVVDLEIKEIELKTEYIDQDTLKWIRAIVLEKDDVGVYTPVEDIEISFFVTRPFNLLPIAEPMSTDQEGKATILFPDDLPGDPSGYVTAVVKIDDSDLYGTVEKRQTIQWGIPTVLDDKSLNRSLWAAGANAPIGLLVLTNSLIAITWGIIFYIIYKLYRVSKL